MPEKGAGPVATIVVCEANGCTMKGGGWALRRALVEKIWDAGLGAVIAVDREICLGHCAFGPNVMICDGALRCGAPMVGAEGSEILQGCDVNKAFGAACLAAGVDTPERKK